MAITLISSYQDPTVRAVLSDFRRAGCDLQIEEDATGTVLTGTVANIWQYQTLRARLGRTSLIVDVVIAAMHCDDAEIAEIAGRICRNEGAAIQVRVRNGIVTLSGTAHPAATTRIGMLPGVAGIVDNTTR